MEVNRIMQEMLTNVDNLMMTESLQQSKETEQKIFDVLDEHKNKITNSEEEINNNKNNISGIDTRVTTLENKMDLSGKNMSEMDQRVQRMKSENE